ncbi:TetR/AcrR family transcriptional regulator [Microbacterium oleivorans]|uniref:TetR/AcrR family transcriptional regulator n=1 Tax=Microbacterium oleivorans TaxID=273677 RepID=UPI0007677B3A|nr:TetR/AcrR family transcriptional regulator [Microbacterium oleivorans]THE07022.1 TetR/AcrR family transcriptional regulator [Microbacterium oleivorans]
MNDPSPRRTYLDVDDRRRQLLDAAVAVMVDDGVSALSLRTVAQRAGVAHRVVSYAFGSKAELVTALLQRESELLTRRLWAEPLAPLPLAEAVSAALRTFIAELQRDRVRHERLAELTAMARASAALAVAARAEVESVQSEIGRLVEAWREVRGAETTVPTATLVAVVHAAAEGLAAWWLATDDDAHVEDVIDVLTSGLAGLERP